MQATETLSFRPWRIAIYENTWNDAVAGNRKDDPGDIAVAETAFPDPAVST